MDVAGYADSDGYTARDDVRPFAYKYRDYLVRSLNADRPWDDLIREQLAGDEMVKQPYANLSPADVDRLDGDRVPPHGPGRHRRRLGRTDAARNDVIAETIKIVSTTLLGLTVGCAQCHDHRYDPISQEDYYRFRALFEPAYDPTNWRPPSPGSSRSGPMPTGNAAADVRAKVAGVARERSEAVNGLVKAVLERELAAAPEDLRGKLRAARETPPSKRSAEQKELLKAYPRINVSPGNVTLYDARAFAAIQKRFAAKTAEAQQGQPAEDCGRGLDRGPRQGARRRTCSTGATRGSPSRPSHRASWRCWPPRRLPRRSRPTTPRCPRRAGGWPMPST